MRRKLIFAAFTALFVSLLCLSASAEWSCPDCFLEHGDDVVICTDCGYERDVLYCEACGAICDPSDMACEVCGCETLNPSPPSSSDPSGVKCPNCDYDLGNPVMGRLNCPAEDCHAMLYITPMGSAINLEATYECFYCGDGMSQDVDNPMRHTCDSCGFSFVVFGDTADYESGHKDGYSEGLAEGFEEGKNQGSAEGYQNGYKEGYDEGYDVGYNDSIDEESERLYDELHDSIYDYAYQEGWDACDYEWEQSDTLVNKFQQGYNKGKAEGFAEGEQSNFKKSFGDILKAIALTPYTAISNMFDFEIFGVNVAGVIFEFFTLAAIFFVIKLFF